MDSQCAGCDHAGDAVAHANITSRKIERRTPAMSSSFDRDDSVKRRMRPGQRMFMRMFLSANYPAKQATIHIMRCKLDRAQHWPLLFAVAGCLLTAARSSAERLPIRTFTTVDGLPNDKVWRIRADSKGFLWFGTSGGLGRYDGSTFVVYGARDGLTSSVIDIIEARDGGYWIATNG